MDRRQQKTRAAIFEAFHRLLARKRFSDITVQQIIDEANVGRSTFYQHFATKDELLEQMCAEIFAHVTSESLASEPTHDFSSGGGASFLAHILYHLRDSRRDLAAILSCESSELFLGYFRQLLEETFRRRYGSRLSACGDLPPEFVLNHLSSSFVEMVKWWLGDRMRRSPEEMERWYLALTEPIFTVPGSLPRMEQTEKPEQ